MVPSPWVPEKGQVAEPTWLSMAELTHPHLGTSSERSPLTTIFVLSIWESCSSSCASPSVFLMTLFHPSPDSWGQYACVLNRFSCVRLFATPGTAAARFPCPRDSPGNNTGVGSHGLLQGMFPIHRSNAWLMSPALAGGLFTTHTTWEALRSV